MSESTARQHAAAEALSFGWLEGVSILLVDDDPACREALALALEDHGARVAAVDSVAAAVEHLEPAPDVILSDIEMPDEDGFELLRRVRAWDRLDGRHTPTVAVTGLGGRAARERLRAAGFDDYFPKPIDLGALVARIRSLV